jgi:antitoxin component of RelBE/YafQ-DinJ toxin-antitoxin module
MYRPLPHGIVVPGTLQAKTDPALRAAIKQFADTMGLTSISAVVRTLIRAGLAKTDAVPVEIKRAAYDEGIRQGLAEFAQRLQKMKTE